MMGMPRRSALKTVIGMTMAALQQCLPIIVENGVEHRRSSSAIDNLLTRP